VLTCDCWLQATTSIADTAESIDKAVVMPTGKRTDGDAKGDVLCLCVTCTVLQQAAGSSSHAACAAPVAAVAAGLQSEYAGDRRIVSEIPHGVRSAV
jgi:hypothetical protein